MQQKTFVLRTFEDYMIFKGFEISDNLPVGEYELLETKNGPILRALPEYKIPEKVYSNDTVFINHVLKTWNTIPQDLGIALVGKKGLGKSFTANFIAKSLGIPIIRVKSTIQSVQTLSFLATIPSDIVLFIDEFEKLFEKELPVHSKTSYSGIYQTDLLSFLDGGYQKEHRIMSIFTSNSKHKISDYLIDRPSRIRYYKEYEEIPNFVIREIIDDKLENIEFRADLLENLPAKGLNIDVLIQIINEINTHQVPYSNFKDFLNFNPSQFKYMDIDLIKVGDKTLPTPIRLASSVGDFIDSHTSIGLYEGKHVYCNTSIRPYNVGAVLQGYYLIEDGLNIPGLDDDNDEGEVPVQLTVAEASNKLANAYTS